MFVLDINNGVCFIFGIQKNLTNSIVKITLPITLKTNYDVICSRVWYNATGFEDIVVFCSYKSTTQIGISCSIKNSTHQACYLVIGRI